MCVCVSVCLVEVSRVLKPTISLVARLATPATMAFGGVPTGKWNAIEQDRAAGNIRYSGCTSISTDSWASTGNMTLATAKFDVNSVRICAVKQIKSRTTMNGNSFIPVSDCPNIADMPESLPPRAKAKPPPSKKIKLHGTLALMYFQVIKLAVACVGRDSAKTNIIVFISFLFQIFILCKWQGMVWYVVNISHLVCSCRNSDNSN